MANQHEHLFANFFGWYDDHDFLYIAMQYFPHGDLSHYIKTDHPSAKLNSREITRQILGGIVVLHERQICHRDLKPAV